MSSDQNRKVRERFSRIRISKAAIVTLLYLLLSSILILIGYNNLSGLNADLFFLFILYSVPFLLYLNTVRKSGLSSTAIFEGSLSDLKQVWFFIPLIIMTYGVIWVTIYLLNMASPDLAVGYFNWLNSVEPFEIGPDTTILQYSLIFFAVAIFVPVVEEIIFRGILIERFGSKYGYKIAVILSSLLFGVLHMDIIGATFFGVVLSILYLRTRSLLLPVLVHAANNGAVMLLIFFGDAFNLEPWDTIEPFLEAIWIGVLLILISFGWLIWFLNRDWKVVHEAEPFPLKTKEEVVETDE